MSKGQSQGTHPSPAAQKEPEATAANQKETATPSTQKEPALSVDPDAAHFLPSGGRSDHMLVNTSDERIVVKVSLLKLSEYASALSECKSHLDS